MKKIALFASGSGTNAENISKYFSNNLSIQVALLISNNPQAGAHFRVNQLNIPSFTYSTEELNKGNQVLEKLTEYEIDWIVLAGFLKKIPETLLKAYPNRIINIHPALLPKFGGKGMYGMHVHEAAVAAGEKQTGITIHYINENYDEGAIIFQATCPIELHDTPEDVAKKVHKLEYTYFPEIIEKVISDNCQK